jgi:hypothetical protein
MVDTRSYVVDPGSDVVVVPGARSSWWTGAEHGREVQCLEVLRVQNA